MYNLLSSTRFKVALLACALMTSAVSFVAANRMWETHTHSGIAQTLTEGDASRAPALFRKYGCSGCHNIAGIPGADGQTGSPLSQFSKRIYIAGILENKSENLIDWIASPQSYSPQIAMPNTGITREEAKDVAAYLYSH